MKAGDSVNTLGSVNISTEDQNNREDVKILYELNVLLKSRSPNTGDKSNSALYYECAFDWYNKPKVEYADITGDFTIIHRNIKMNEISLLKNVDKNVKREIKRIKLYTKNNKIILRINIPVQTDFALTAETFALKIIDAIFEDKELKDKIDINSSGYEQFDIMSDKKDDNDDVKFNGDKVSDLDAKMSAIFSHYIYYYLDYLELQTLHKSFFNKLINDKKTLIEDIYYVLTKSAEIAENDVYSPKNYNIPKSSGQSPKVSAPEREKSEKNKDEEDRHWWNALKKVYAGIEIAFSVVKPLVSIPLNIFPIHPVRDISDRATNKISKMNKDKFSTGIFCWGGGNKVLYRIINRLHEIYSIISKDNDLKFPEIVGKFDNISIQCDFDDKYYVDSEDVKVVKDTFDIDKVIEQFNNASNDGKEKILKEYRVIEALLIYKAFIESIKYPMDFYELYDIFKYWDYLKHTAQDGNTIREEAKKWHIVHLSTRNTPKETSEINNGNRFLIQEKLKESGEAKGYDRTGFRYRTDSIHYGWYHGLSGYGGGLLVRMDEDGRPSKFVFSTKGTDANSFNDWVIVDIVQGLSGLSLQHFQTVKNAIVVDKCVKSLSKEKNRDLSLYFCGHSLGGGLASSNALATGREAITFNAAGLNFIGGLWTRVVGGVFNGKMKEAISPLAVANKVYPIRILGEMVDVVMIASKPLTLNLNQRGYGRYSLVLQNVKLGSAAKHGINNFLNNNIMNELRICKSATGIRKISNVVVKSSKYGIPTNKATAVEMTPKERDTGNTFTFPKNSLAFNSAGIISFKDLIPAK